MTVLYIDDIPPLYLVPMRIIRLMILAVVMSTKITAQAPVSHSALHSSQSLPTWQIDLIQSELSFSARHLLTRVRGQFTQWGGTIVADPQDWNTASISVTVQAASLTTHNDERDADLRSSNFFDVKKFPTVNFVSTKVVRSGDSVKVFGKLTMHGVTKPVILAGKLVSMSKTDEGKSQASFTAETMVNRTDYGMVWNRVIEGGMMVGDEVTIKMSVVAIQQ